ncbi:MAG: terminase family protein [Bifidobacteriaceae bacterium]|nr:terminase family protein [Bifidobacteriaceae bacterium]MCI1979417.1 terminase family protein [Bifidobacteriaceae bacterium]
MTPMRSGTRRNFERETDGPIVGEFARLLGTPLLPWQQYVADVAGEIDPTTGSYYYDDITLTTPRQSGKSELLKAETTRNSLHGKKRKIFYLAQTGKDSDKYFKDYVETLASSKLAALAKRPKLSNGGMEQAFTNGSIISPVAVTKKAGHGVQGDLICIDEAFALSNDLAKIIIDGFLPTVATRFKRTGVQPQVWVTSTEGTSESEFFNERLDKLRRGEGSTHSAFFDWGIPFDSDPEDLENIYKHHPAAGYLWDFNQLQAFRDGFEDNVGGWARAFGNLRDKGRAERIFSPDLWATTTTITPIDNTTLTGQPLAFGAAVDIEASATTICAAVAIDDHVTVQRIDMLPGTGAAFSRLHELQERYHAPLLIDSHGSGAALYDRLSHATDTYNVPLFNLLDVTNSDVLSSSQAFLSGLEEGRISHVADDELDLSAANAARQWVGDSWRTSRHLPTGHSSPIEAAILATWAVTHLPADSWG